MLLKEFDLDLEYIENKKYIERMMASGLSEKEAKLYDYINNWKWKRAHFRWETRCITSMFERYFHPFRADFWKILILCVPEYHSDEIKVVGKICEVQVDLNYDEFLQANNHEKKRITLDTLYNGLERVVNKFGWEIFPFSNVKDKIIELNFQNKWFFRRPVFSPDKKYHAQVYLEHEPDSIDISMVIRNKSGIIGKKLLTSEIPDEFCYTNLLGRVEWKNNEQVSLITQQYDKEFIVSISEIVSNE